MTPEQARGRLFKITAKHSNKSLDVRASSNVPGQPEPPGRLLLCQRQFSSKDSQKFLLFPLDDGSFVVASRSSGRVLDIFGKSNDDRAFCHLHPYHGEQNQRFLLQDVGNGFSFIRAKHSGKVLDVKDKSKANGALVHQFHEKGSNDIDNQLFKFEEVGTYQVPASSFIADVGPAPQPTSLDSNLPETTADVLTAESLVPYFLVDEALPLDKQIAQTPYYNLQKVQAWKQVFERRFSGPAQTFNFKVVTGMTKSVSKTMEKTVGITIDIGGEAGFGPKWLPLKIGLSASLKITETTSTEMKTEETFEHQITYPGGQPILFAQYSLLNRFALRRADGIEVKERWEAVNANETRQVSFPEGTVSARRI